MGATQAIEDTQILCVVLRSVERKKFILRRRRSVESPISSDGVGVLDGRFEAYSQEAVVLERKLGHPQVPEGKKQRCRVRLDDLRRRLMPGVIREMQGR